MAYEQHTWQSNEFVTAEKLNNIENGVAYSQGKKWEVTIAANNWTLDNDVYTYTTSLGDITSASWVDASAHGYEDYFTDPIDWEIKNNNVVEFSTTSAPTGTVIITVVAWGTVEGTEGEIIVPIYDGVDSTDANKALSAKQGKIINDKITAIETQIGTTDISSLGNSLTEAISSVNDNKYEKNETYNNTEIDNKISQSTASILPLRIENGGTGATTASGARTALGITFAPNVSMNFTASTNGAYCDYDFGKSVYVLSASILTNRTTKIIAYSRVSGFNRWSFLLDSTSAHNNVNVDLVYIVF